MMKNEKTSRRVASIAGRVHKALAEVPVGYRLYIYVQDAGGAFADLLSVGDVKKLAASALTQAPNKVRAKLPVKRKR